MRLNRGKMAKNIVTTVDKEKIICRVNEQELVDEILKKEFFIWMKDNGYGYKEIKEIFDGKRLSAAEQSKFNSTVRRIKKEENISITETIVFLEESFTKFKKILSIFDGETKFELKKELSKKYHIKLDETNLSQILV